MQEPPIIVERRPDPRARPNPSSSILIAVGALLVLIAAFAAWYWLYRDPGLEPPPIVAADPAPIASPPPTPALTEPPARVPEPEPLATAPAAPLPALDESDAELTGALSELLGAQALERTLRPDGFIRRLVVSIDNLAREGLPLERRSVHPIPGAFVVRGTEEMLFLGDENFARYSTFTTLVSRTESRAIVELYRRYYPLLQQAYLELGNPDMVFSARLIEIIDHLLEAPEIDGAIALRQPNVLYEFADPELEALSSGHKILIRMGPENAAIVKTKLREIRALLVR